MDYAPEVISVEPMEDKPEPDRWQTRFDGFNKESTSIFGDNPVMNLLAIEQLIKPRRNLDITMSRDAFKLL